MVTLLILAALLVLACVCMCALALARAAGQADRSSRVPEDAETPEVQESQRVNA